jgi:hypothetical protein
MRHTIGFIIGILLMTLLTCRNHPLPVETKLADTIINPDSSIFKYLIISPNGDIVGYTEEEFNALNY